MATPFQENKLQPFSILLRSLTSTFICRQANASSGVSFPKQAHSKQKKWAALISAASLFSQPQPIFFKVSSEMELARDQTSTENSRAHEQSDTDCGSSN